MQNKEYSAGAVKFSFWFAEFRKVVFLLRSGIALNDIKELAVSNNIFSAVTPIRSGQIFSTVSARVSSLSDDYYKLFETSGIDTQKLIALLAVMETDTLFFDFMNDVYKEKLITSDTYLTDADMRVFFTDKGRQSEKISTWTDKTFDRLRSCYKTYLAEAGLLKRGIGDRIIIKPLVEDRLAILLCDTNKKQVYNIFTGTR